MYRARYVPDNPLGFPNRKLLGRAVGPLRVDIRVKNLPSKFPIPSFYLRTKINKKAVRSKRKLGIEIHSHMRNGDEKWIGETSFDEF